jgi:hypothetical protein
VGLEALDGLCYGGADLGLDAVMAHAFDEQADPRVVDAADKVCRFPERSEVVVEQPDLLLDHWVGLHLCDSMGHLS